MVIPENNQDNKNNVQKNNGSEVKPSDNEELKERNPILKDNSWGRYLKNMMKLFWVYCKAYYPIIFFGLVSYGGTKCGTRIFKKYIQPKLEASETV